MRDRGCSISYLSGPVHGNIHDDSRCNVPCSGVGGTNGGADCEAYYRPIGRSNEDSDTSSFEQALGGSFADPDGVAFGITQCDPHGDPNGHSLGATDTRTHLDTFTTPHSIDGAHDFHTGSNRDCFGGSHHWTDHRESHFYAIDSSTDIRPGCLGADW